MQEEINPFLALEDLDHFNRSVRSTPSKSEVRFPCGQCGGSGHYQGARVHQEKSHCFACRGNGYFLTDPRKLKARREQQAQSKAHKLQTALDAFKEQHPQVYEALREVSLDHARGNEFLCSLATQLFGKGMLSDKQVEAWYRGRARLEEMKAQREKEQKAIQVSVDLTPIRNMFETAAGNGYKKPTYRAEGLILSRAPEGGRNPGALYVKNEDDAYLGKIIGTDFQPTREGQPAVAILLEIAKDPLAAALRYGQRTGRCACCGRELTNHASIDLGIGPICKDKWGL